MFYCRRAFTVAAAAAISRSASSNASAAGRPVADGAEAMEKSGTAAMHSLYRRLLKAGEEGSMMQHCLTVNSLSESLAYGLRLLRLHRELTNVDAVAQTTPWWRMAKRTRHGIERRYYAWSLLALRLQLRSRNAIADVLVYLLFLTMCFLLYEIYRACRIGVNRAEERYRTLSIPIIQTLDALEAAQARKRELRKEMEKDIVRERIRMAEVRQQKSNRAVSEVVDYLQLAGQHYREHVELLRQEQAVKDAQHAPFKPHVSLYAKRVGKNSVVRQSSSIGARLHELHEKKLALLKEEAEEEARRRAAAEAEDCSFAPAVTTRAARSRRAEGDVAMALIRWGEQRRVRQARAQLEATRNELSKVSAAPRITAYADEKARAERRSVSVEVSLTADAEARRQRRHAAFEKAYPIASSSSSVASSARCFSPSISAHASRIEVEEDVVSRLYERSRGSRGHVALRERLYDEEAALHCTFHPKLSAQTAELSRRYYEEEGEADTDPHERLFRNKHHAYKYRKPAQLSVFTGHPEISDASRRIVEERRRQQALDGQPGALGLSPGSRLCPRTASVAAAEVMKTSKKALSDRDIEVQEALTFAPSVSPASEALWRQRVSALKASGAARNTEEARRLLWRKAEKRKEEEMLKLQDERRKKEAAECTFRPKPGRPPQRSSGYVAMPIEARTALWAQQRDRRLADLRTELNDITVEECTFRPHVDPVFPLPRHDARPAWGVEAFLERQAEARRLRKEAEQWWRPKYTRMPVTEASRVSCWRSPRHRGASRSSLPRAASTSRRDSASNTASESGGDEGLVFEQHWARPPASTSLSASSFSRVSQQEVPSAELSPSHVMQQHSSTRVSYEAGITQGGPYQWRSPSAAGASQVAAEENADCAAALPPWRKPLRYRPISLTATVPRLRSAAL